MSQFFSSKLLRRSCCNEKNEQVQQANVMRLNVKINLSVFNVSLNSFKKFIPSVNKFLNSWCKKTDAGCCSSHWQMTDCTSVSDNNNNNNNNNSFISNHSWQYATTLTSCHAGQHRYNWTQRTNYNPTKHNIQGLAWAVGSYKSAPRLTTML